MSWQQVSAEVQQFSPRLDSREGERAGGRRGLNTEGSMDDDGEDEDGIDLEGYEEYLEHLKSKEAIRPCSARVIRPVPTESSQFFGANAGNHVPTRPARPVSARPRMRSTPRNALDGRTLNGSQSSSSGVGVRRKRQGEKLVHARIRAVYNDVGRSFSPMKQMATSSSVSSTLTSKSKNLQEAELHDEYYRLLDAESELKATCLQEQQKRVKALAHARRLEEIIAMKDKKIEALLHDKAVGADRSLSTSRSVAQREMAERDRQFHALTQKLRQKIAQQSQLLSSYEEAMQSLRSGMKSTNLMELEEERSQLYEELRHHQELLDRQRLEWGAHQQKLVAFAAAEGSSKLQIAKLLQENKVIAHEKRKLEQEVGFLKSRVELLQSTLSLEQRKRTYDREFSESVGKHTSSSPTQKVMLAQALEEMKKLMRRETIASIKREKLKSPKADAIPTRSGVLPATQSLATVPPAEPPASSAPKTPGRPTLASPRQPRPSSAARARPYGVSSRQATAKASSRQSPDSRISRPDAKLVIETAATTPTSVAQTATFKQNDEHFREERMASNTEQHTEASVTASALSVEKIPGNRDAQLMNATLLNTDPTDAVSETEECGKGGFLQMDQLVCPKADPGVGGQNSFAEVKAIDQITDEEMSAIQQQTLAAAESVLRLDVDEDFDSELSADLLDDAQHPMLRSDTEVDVVASVDSTANAALSKIGAPKQAGDIPFVDPTLSPPEIEATRVEASSDSSQALDDLYPCDFLDSDAQPSMGNDSECGEEDARSE